MNSSHVETILNFTNFCSESCIDSVITKTNKSYNVKLTMVNSNDGDYSYIAIGSSGVSGGGGFVSTQGWFY